MKIDNKNSIFLTSGTSSFEKSILPLLEHRFIPLQQFTKNTFLFVSLTLQKSGVSCNINQR